MRTIQIKAERPHKTSPNINVSMKTVIKGKISKNQLTKAINKLITIHPLLSSVIKADEDGSAYYVLDSISSIEPIWIEQNEQEAIDWRTVLLEQDRVVFDMVNGPLIRYILIHGEESSVLMSIGHHLLGDGMSHMYMIRDLLILLGDIDADMKVKEPHIINSAADLPVKSAMGFLPKLLVKNINKAWKKDNRVFTYDEYVKMFNDYRSKHTAQLDVITIDGQRLTSLIDTCHKTGTSVNDAVTTAFLYGVQKALGIQGRTRIGIGVNIRDEMTVNPQDSMGNYVSGISITGEYDYNKDFAYNTRSIRDNYKPKLKNLKNRFIVLHLFLGLEDGVLDAMQYAAYAEFDNKAAKQVAQMVGEICDNKGIGVTNLGRINIAKQYGEFELDELMFICPSSPGNVITFGISTYNDRMNICVRYNSEIISKEMAAKIENYVDSML